MTQEADKWAIAEERERQLILRALAIAIAAKDAILSDARADADRNGMADLLTRLADKHELELHGQYAVGLIIRIADRRAGRT